MQFGKAGLAFGNPQQNTNSGGDAGLNRRCMCMSLCEPFHESHCISVVTSHVFNCISWPAVKACFFCSTWIPLESLSRVLIYLSGRLYQKWWMIAGQCQSQLFLRSYLVQTQSSTNLNVTVPLTSKGLFEFISSQLQSSLSIMGMIKMFWSCL